MAIRKLTKEGRFECGLDAIVRGKVWAFVPVMGQPGGPAAALGVAVANEAGYMPIAATWCNADTYDEMADYADELNRAEGLDDEVAMRIVASSMAAQNLKRREAS